MNSGKISRRFLGDWIYWVMSWAAGIAEGQEEGYRWKAMNDRISKLHPTIKPPTHLTPPDCLDAPFRGKKEVVEGLTEFAPPPTRGRVVGELGF